MQRKVPMTRLASSELPSSRAQSDSDDVLSQVQTLSSSAALTSSTADGISLLVKGKPLSLIIQILADALLQQQAQLQRSREATEAHARQTDAVFAEHKAVLGKVKNDLHFDQRPFILGSGANAANALSRTGSAGKEGRVVPLHRQCSAETMGEAIQLAHKQHEKLRHQFFSTSASVHERKLQHTKLRYYFQCWCDAGVRRVRAKELETASKVSLLATFYTRWRRRAESDWRQQQLRRERHLRAVSRRSQKAILATYLRKWVRFATAAADDAARLRAYQRRIAHTWSLSGPAVTLLRRGAFRDWLKWTCERKAVQHAIAAAEVKELSSAESRLRTLLTSCFHLWQKKTRRRQLVRLYHRLARVMAAQSHQVLLRNHFRTWVTCAERMRTLRRLEVLAADQHKRRVTALARRYFNELRFFRREQQFQRMMRSVEASLLTLADRVGNMEDVMHAQRPPRPSIAAPPAAGVQRAAPAAAAALSYKRPLFESPSRAPQSIPSVQWSPATDDDLLARVEELLSRSR